MFKTPLGLSLDSLDVLTLLAGEPACPFYKHTPPTSHTGAGYGPPTQLPCAHERRAVGGRRALEERRTLGEPRELQQGQAIEGRRTRGGRCCDLSTKITNALCVDAAGQRTSMSILRTPTSRTRAGYGQRTPLIHVHEKHAFEERGTLEEPRAFEDV